MNALVLALIFAFSTTPTFGAPQALDAATLRRNALDAQMLNTEFQCLKEADPCDSGLTACSGGTLAQCVHGSWQLQECNDSQRCFAVPSVRERGTLLTCTSEAHALSLIQAAGVSGGLFANTTNHTVSYPTSAISSVDSPAPTTSSSTSVDPADAGVAVVTVTVTMPLTLPAETTTLSPQNALSVIASLSSKGFIVSSVPTAGSAATSGLEASTQPTKVGRTTEPTSGPSNAAVVTTAIPIRSSYRRHSLRARRPVQL